MIRLTVGVWLAEDEDAGEWQTARANLGHGLGRCPVETVWLAAEADAGCGQCALRLKKVGAHTGTVGVWLATEAEGSRGWCSLQHDGAEPDVGNGEGTWDAADVCD